MNQSRRAVEVVELLASLGHECALVGGLAVSVRGRERFTRDVDFAVAVENDEEAEALTFAMQERRYTLKEVIEQEVLDRLGTVRFRHPDDRVDEPSVDLLFASSGIENEIVEQATLVEWAPGISIPVASLPHLVAMKVLSEQENREQDRADLRVLLCVATDSEIDEARRLVRLIEERGFHRGRDMRGNLREFLDQMREP